MLRYLQPVGLSHRWIDSWRYYMDVFNLRTLVISYTSCLLTSVGQMKKQSLFINFNDA